MKHWRLTLLAVAVLAVSLWLGGCFDPAPKVLINRQLKKLAGLASFPPDEPSFRRFTKIEKMGALFAEDVTIHLDSIETETRELHGRAELMEFAMGAKSIGNGLKVEFLDINIDMGPEKQSAVVDLTMKARFGGDSDFIPQELEFVMKKTKGEWLISRVESVKPLRP